MKLKNSLYPMSKSSSKALITFIKIVNMPNKFSVMIFQTYFADLTMQFGIPFT